MKYKSGGRPLKIIVLAGLFWACQPTVNLPTPPLIPPPPPERQLIDDLLLSAQLNESIDSTYTLARKKGLIPYVFDDSVYFIYRGKAETVAWNGDFNSWGNDQSLNNAGIAVGDNLWVLKMTLPRDARVDYKIVVDDQWILDPAHRNYQYTGVGGGTPNSSLAMPKFTPDSLSFKIASDTGQIISNNLIRSASLGYTVSYEVYLPPGYDSLKNLPLLILTDGQEFSHSKLGRISHILDNLISSDRIEPIITILIDPRNPENTDQNRRIKELANNPAYAKFLISELLPLIRSRLNISSKRDDIALAGVSLGGLNGAYTGHLFQSKVGKLGIMSPAFWYKPQIFDQWVKLEMPMRVYISAGTIHDGKENTDKFVNQLKINLVDYHYDTIPQGHSWGNWRYLSDNMLIYLFGK